MKQMKLAEILRSKYKKMTRPGKSKTEWYKYVRRLGIKFVSLPGFMKLVNANKLKGKTVVQSDFMCSLPCLTMDDLQNSEKHASDIWFYVFNTTLADTILALGEMPP